MIRASICIAAYGKPAHLDRTLASIFRQTLPFEIEVIVVDDGTPDDSIRDVCFKYPRVCYYFNEKKGGYGNPAKARNIAYKLASGNILVCQSDDVEHQGNTIQALVKELHQGTFVIARVLNVAMNGTPIKNPLYEFTGPGNQRPLFFLGAVHRNDVYAIGGNDEEFTEPGREDVFFSQCLIHGLGLKPFYSSQALGHHLDHSRPGDTAAPSQASVALYKSKLRAITNGQAKWIGGPTWSTIPKTVSLFWSGKMSWLRWLTLYSLRKYNPDYKVVLLEPPEDYVHKREWTTNERADETAEGFDYRNRLEELGVERQTWQPPFADIGKAQCSDLCEWDRLATVGGFYSDLDILWVRPLDELRARYKLCNAAFCLENGALAIGFFAASPNSPVFRGVYEAAVKRGNVKDYQGFGTSSLYTYAGVFYRRSRISAKGLRAIIELKNLHPTLNLEVLPDQTVYPFDWTQIDSIFDDHYDLPQETYGLHWFGGSNQAQRIGPKLTEEEWLWRSDTTIGKVISKILYS